MKELLNAMRLQAQLAGQGRITKMQAIVSSYDPTNYCAKVRLQPTDIETGWLPVTSAWVGNGWGMFCPPSQGDVVDVHFQEDDTDAGYIVTRFFNDSARPLSVPSGELWLVHASGAFFKLTNDGKGTFSDGHGASVVLNGDGTITSAASQWNHTGPMTVTGNVVINGTEQVTGQITGQGGMSISGGTGSSVSGNMSFTGGTLTHSGKNIGSTHTHSGVTAGASNTGAPN